MGTINEADIRHEGRIVDIFIHKKTELNCREICEALIDRFLVKQQLDESFYCHINIVLRRMCRKGTLTSTTQEGNKVKQIYKLN